MKNIQSIKDLILNAFVQDQSLFHIISQDQLHYVQRVLELKSSREQSSKAAKPCSSIVGNLIGQDETQQFKYKLMLSFNNIGNLEEKFLFYEDKIMNETAYKLQIEKFEKLIKDEEFRRRQILMLQSALFSSKEKNKYKIQEDSQSSSKVRIANRIDLYIEWMNKIRKNT
ncbi:UNKNOWN [Stylonychia lemnae]|uniref:Uncharacterized protein n=1 Tax=Stylonychia lemnae TaxID=5949 RepID=A0A078AA01_STYLE|nr:UNKNOWN [Stylonychia lemnae]|eukprot:CDW77643.1 UNKNOWN [Stylonychia lemnae]